MGTFPAVTACAHATIGTGAFPRVHGITGHNVRRDGRPVKAWGTPGEVDPSFLMVPTLADAWSEATGDGAWIGEVGYQVWHLGMIGRGGNRPLGDKPVGVYWDENGGGGRHQAQETHGENGADRKAQLSEAGNREFNTFLWLPPNGMRAGDILFADSTVFSTLFGVDESLARFWKNLATAK